MNEAMSKMKQMLPLLMVATAVSGCCEMAYGPSRCAKPPVFEQGNLAVAPQVAQVPAAPAPALASAAVPPVVMPVETATDASGTPMVRYVTIAPQNLAPASYTPPAPPQQAAPVMPTAPFMQGPSIQMPDAPQADNAGPADASPQQTTSSPAEAQAPAADSWLHM